MRDFHLMGVVNATPDSFSDGGSFLAPEDAIAHGRVLAAEGAEMIDVGGESTRPGAEPVSEAEELRRVLPVIEGLADALATEQLSFAGVTAPAVERGGQGSAVPGQTPAAGAKGAVACAAPSLPVGISIDTCKAAVAAAALARGASMVNDVSALRADPRMAEVIAGSGASCCLMHMIGSPRTMQSEARYNDVVLEVRDFLAERIEAAVAAGIDERRIIVDPGIGFGKSLHHNLQLIARLQELAVLGRPVLIGTSRKSFIGVVAESWRRDRQAPPADQRLAGTIASNLLAFERGASWFRAHEVGPVGEALQLAAATFAEDV